MPTSAEILGILNTVPTPGGGISDMKIKIGISNGLSIFLPKVVWKGVGGSGTAGVGVGTGVGVGAIQIGGVGRMLIDPLVVGTGLQATAGLTAIINTLGSIERLPLRMQVSCVGIGGIGTVVPVPNVVVSPELDALYTVLLADIKAGLVSAGLLNASTYVIEKVSRGIISLLRTGIVISSPVGLISPSPPICAPTPVPVAGLPITAICA